MRRSLIVVALTALLGAFNACSSTNAGAPSVPPVSSTPAPTSAAGTLTTSTTQSTSLSLGPIGSGDLGTIALPPTNVVSHLSVVYSLGQPAGTPTVSAIHRAPRAIGGANIATFAYFTATPDVTVTAPTPAFSMTFAAGTLPSGTTYAAMYDPGNSANGWTTISGPGTVAGNTISWTAGNYPFSFVAGRTYAFALFTTISTLAVASPPPSPSPSLLRFMQASPDAASGGAVDVCIDQAPFGGASPTPTVSYGRTTGLYSVAGGMTHTISVYTAVSGSGGAECASAPAAYAGAAPLAVAALTIGKNVRWTAALAGTVASGTLGIYVFNEPTYPTVPGGVTAITHNVAPAFSLTKPGVGFGICTTTVTPCASPVVLKGSASLASPTASTTSSTAVNATVASGLSSIPAGFYDGIGVSAGTPVPITSVAAPSPVAFQPYVVQLYAFDAPAGGLNLLAFIEQTTGFGF
ncbi:MAG TPA: hypothetical protein VGN14_08935 [Candidatus Elarobacter sp.]